MWFILDRRVLWSTVSDAFCRSINTPHAELSLSSADRINSVRLIRTWFVECLSRKPNWKLERTLFLFKKLVSQICMIYSKVLLMLERRDMGRQLLQSSLSPFLWMGIIFATLRALGNITVVKELLIMSLRGL